ncbi:MAG: hypothetical protein ABI041_04740 [Bdellovibrionia bacterium]
MGNKTDCKVNKSTNQKPQTEKDKTVEVLYQKLGDRWFAFSMIDDEVFVGSINQSEIDSNRKARPHQGHK